MDSNPPIITPEDTIFSIDESNKKCVDCGSDKPTMVSVNNGVTLCDACSKIHSEFGKAISYLRPISGEWDDYLLNFLVLGSNSKFVRTLEVLGVNLQLPPEQKYKTYAVDYYRRNLKAKVIGVKAIDVDYANANDIIQTPIDNYPEFDNYVLKKGDQDNQISSHNINNNSNNEKIEKNEDKKVEEVPQEKITTGKKIAGFFGKLKNKIKSGGQKTLEGLKKAGTFMEEKTAPARAKIKQGATFVGSQVKSAYEDLKTKIVKNKKTEKEGNAIIVNVDTGENGDNKEEDEKNKQEKNSASDTVKEENQEKKETQSI